MRSMTSPRTIRSTEGDKALPIYAVWEITLRCDQACAHCGSRAGPEARDAELDTAELLSVADALIRLGNREVTLIGGEAYLRGDVYDLIAHLTKHGVRVSMQTGGRGLTPARVRRLRDAGLAAVGVSVDGSRAVHDELRDNPGSYDAALGAIAHAREAGLTVTSNTQVNRLNMGELPEIARALEQAGSSIWRVHLTVPMGRGADRPEWILQPYMILAVIDSLAAIQAEAKARADAAGVSQAKAFRVALGNNLGYYGPHESKLRSRPDADDRYYMGCQAGRYSLGIESDGVVKGCPSLPTAPYTAGNVRDMSLEDIWAHSEAMRFTRDRTRDELWGHCATCYYADLCRGGCSFTTHTALGRRGNNPFCYYRADQLRKRGIREVIVQAERAQGRPYDFGRFELREQPWSDAPPPDVRGRLPVVY